MYDSCVPHVKQVLVWTLKMAIARRFPPVFRRRRWMVGATLGARRTFWPAGNTVARFEKRRVRWSTVERWDRLGSKTEVRGGPS